MLKITYYIGKYDKDTYKQELSNDYFIKQIIKTIGECTIFRAKGCYIDTKARCIVEPSVKVIQLLNDTEDYAKQNAITTAKTFKKLFNQEQILFTVEPIEYEVV